LLKIVEAGLLKNNHFIQKSKRTPSPPHYTTATSSCLFRQDSGVHRCTPLLLLLLSSVKCSPVYTSASFSPLFRLQSPVYTPATTGS